MSYCATENCISHPDCTSGIKRPHTSSEILARFARNYRMHMLRHRTQHLRSLLSICSGPTVVLVAKNASLCKMSTSGKQKRQQSAFSSRQAEVTSAQTASAKQEGNSDACNHSPKELRGPEFAFGNARKNWEQTAQGNVCAVQVGHDAGDTPTCPASPRRWQV